MTRSPRRLLSALVLLGGQLAAGCAHTPAAAASSAGREGQAAPVVVTGSRLPQRVDLRSGLPATTSPVRIWTRRDLDRTGVAPSDLGAALRKLDPALD